MTARESAPSEVHRFPAPSGFRMIASGDIVPVFDPQDPARWIVLYDDGSVRWSDREDL